VSESDVTLTAVSKSTASHHNAQLWQTVDFSSLSRFRKSIEVMKLEVPTS